MEEKLTPIGSLYSFERIDIFASKAGRVLFVTVYCVCPKHFVIGSIETLDEIRNNIRQALTVVNNHAEVQVVLTAREDLESHLSKIPPALPVS
jgi:predicted Co/Zn/Cd cation transporter (cation efflux family)